MTKKQSNLILGVLLALVIALGIFGYLRQRQTDNNVTPVIMEHLVKPYYNAISNRDYEFAYFKLTSDEFKKSYSLQQYVAAQNANFERFGKLKALKPISGLFLTERSESKPWIYKGTLMYIGEKDSVRIEIDVIYEKNDFRIYQTFRSFLTISSVKPLIF